MEITITMPVVRGLTIDQDLGPPADLSEANLGRDALVIGDVHGQAGAWAPLVSLAPSGPRSLPRAPRHSSSPGLLVTPAPPGSPSLPRSHDHKSQSEEPRTPQDVSTKQIICHQISLGWSRLSSVKTPSRSHQHPAKAHNYTATFPGSN